MMSEPIDYKNLKSLQKAVFEAHRMSVDWTERIGVPREIEKFVRVTRAKLWEALSELEEAQAELEHVTLT